MKKTQARLILLSVCLLTSQAWALVVDDQASCEALPADTSWTSDPGIVPGNCHLNSNLTITDLDVRMVFTVEAGVTLQTQVLNCSQATCRIQNNGQMINDGGTISVDRSLARITNAGLIFNVGGSIVIEGAWIENNGTILNNGLIKVDCGRLENNGTFLGAPIDAAYCWTGSVGDWSDPGNWSHNGPAPTSPDENARIWIRGGVNANDRVHLDVDFTVGNILELGARFFTGQADGSQLIVDPGAKLRVDGTMGVAANTSVVNESILENYGTLRGRIDNRDRIYNEGTLTASLENRDGALFENAPAGTVRLAPTNHGQIDNAGFLQIGTGAGSPICDPLAASRRRCWLNYGSITNVSGGTLNIAHGLWIRDDGRLDNTGTVRIRERFSDVGGLIGPGLLKVERLADVLNATSSLIEVRADAAIENRGRFENIGVLEIDGSVSNDGHLCGPGLISGNLVTGVEPVFTCDLTPPVIVPTLTGTLGNDGWYVSDITLTWSVTDDGSQIFFRSNCVEFNLQNDTPGGTLSCSATSFGGYAQQGVTWKRDATPPTFAPVLTPDPVIHGLPATVVANAEDAPFGSGLAGSGCDPVDSSTLGAHVVRCHAVDVAGNMATIDAPYEVVTPGIWFTPYTTHAIVGQTLLRQSVYQVPPGEEIVNLVTSANLVSMFSNMVALDVKANGNILFAVEETVTVPNGNKTIRLFPGVIYRWNGTKIKVKLKPSSVGVALSTLNALDQVGGSYYFSVDANKTLRVDGVRYRLYPSQVWRLRPSGTPKLELVHDFSGYGFDNVDGADLLPDGRWAISSKETSPSYGIFHENVYIWDPATDGVSLFVRLSTLQVDDNAGFTLIDGE